MLTLPRFEWLAPASVDEALLMLADAPAGERLVVAGGTDAVPNMKHRLHEPRAVVHIGGLPELHFLRETDDGLEIGPLVTLTQISRSPLVRRGYPSLATAAGLVASPQIRNMGTIGGNLCLDTRCTYYNQTYFWRSALRFCLKKDGAVCHVVPGGQKCVAAHSSDVSPVLISLGAEVEVASAEARYTLPVEDFFVANGIHNTVLRPNELVTRIFVPARSRDALVAYAKLRPRGAIDFPMLSVAFAARMNSTGCEWARLVISALAAKPRIITGVNTLLDDAPLDDDTFEAVAQAAYKQCHPLINVPYDEAYRREMVPVFVKRVVKEALSGAAAS